MTPFNTNFVRNVFGFVKPRPFPGWVFATFRVSFQRIRLADGLHYIAHAPVSGGSEQTRLTSARQKLQSFRMIARTRTLLHDRFGRRRFGAAGRGLHAARPRQAGAAGCSGRHGAAGAAGAEPFRGRTPFPAALPTAYTISHIICRD